MQKKFKIRRDARLNTLVTRRSEEERRRMKDRLRNGFTQCLTQAPEERKNVETDPQYRLRKIFPVLALFTTIFLNKVSSTLLDGPPQIDNRTWNVF
ncbi:hypothetical protein KQX54_006957 [Cotesia glomerata]|uniref:Uncharacterized protein n=1 Tax=Cotesia glomerata TaxID=32391 RepID=A0AAV7I4P0_COTGL|nr:hypothetical protein KQX54_006957 [Cotesia glomerata]